MTGWLVGLDIGSTTVKAIALPASDGGAIAWQRYQRHETRQAETVLQTLLDLERDLAAPPSSLHLYVTGSGASALAPILGARYVQEVNAVALAAEKYSPAAQSVIELGGQDAKMIFFEPGPGGGRRKVATMNDQCAGGTGAILDKLSAKLQLTADDLARQRYRGVRLHPVAAKCGVFAESDITGLQKRGVPAGELMASLFEAIVLQNLTVLTRGHVPRPQVLLLGGPNVLLPGLREAWQAHLTRLWASRDVELPADAPPEERIVCPGSGLFFAALGAIEYGREEVGDYCYRGVAHLEHWMRRGGADRTESRPGLRGAPADFARFLSSYGGPVSKATLTPGAPARLFLGIDGGSTSTKAALLDADGAVRATAYRLSQGNPLEDCRVLARELRAQAAGRPVEILGAAVTGYAKDLLAGILNVDAATVETVAHARAGIAAMPGVEIIVDIGGQDIKLVVLKDGHVKDFMLNTQCSAGNGYFLQSTAQAFRIPLDDFAGHAFRAARCPIFSTGCAVFLQAEIVNFQRQGWSPSEILAGLAQVLPRNIWLYVAKVPNPSLLGRRFLLQGGTQHNLAAVKAQLDYLRSCFAGTGREPDVAVHPYCGEAGAIGAALEALDLWRRGHRTRFPGLVALEEVQFDTTTSDATRCGYCQNHCPRTFIDYHFAGASGRFITANCEKGAAREAAEVRGILQTRKAVERANPDLVALAARTVFEASEPPSAARPLPRFAVTTRQTLRRRRSDLRIGIPRVFHQYLYGGFFSTYLQALGVRKENLRWSPVTSGPLYRAAAGRGAIDPCFPSKVALAHVHTLLDQPLDAIFFPMFDAVESSLEKTLGTNACSTVIATPLSVGATFRCGGDEFQRRGVRYLTPLLNFADRPLLARQLFECWDPLLGLHRVEHQRALELAVAQQHRWLDEMRDRSRDVLDALELEDRLGIVLLGRPYHHDPGLNHGLPAEFQRRGYPVFSQTTLPIDADLLDRLFGPCHPLDIEDVWQHAYSASTTQKVWAAKFTARHPNLIGVELSNFRCGHDAPAYHLIEQILEAAGRPYFGFKDLDENRPSASFRLRIETIHHFLQQNRSELVRQRTTLVPGIREGEPDHAHPESGAFPILQPGLPCNGSHERPPHDRRPARAACASCGTGNSS